MNARRDELWGRVERALDDRGDPFADPALARALEADPALAASAQRLVARLDLVAALRAPRRRARWLAAGVAVAAALALAFLLPLATRSRPQPAGDAAGVAAAPPSVPALSLVVELAALPVEPAPDLEPRRIVRWTLEGDRP